MYTLGTGLVIDCKRVLLDFRPSLSLLSTNALSASNCFLIPILVDYMAAEDLADGYDGVG